MLDSIASNPLSARKRLLLLMTQLAPLRVLRQFTSYSQERIRIEGLSAGPCRSLSLSKLPWADAGGIPEGASEMRWR